MWGNWGRGFKKKWKELYVGVIKRNTEAYNRCLFASFKHSSLAPPHRLIHRSPLHCYSIFLFLQNFMSSTSNRTHRPIPIAAAAAAHNLSCSKHPLERLHIVAARSTRPRLRCRLCSTAATRSWRESHPMQRAWQSLVQRVKRKCRDSNDYTSLDVMDLSWEGVGKRAVEGAMRAVQCTTTGVAAGESEPMHLFTHTDSEAASGKSSNGVMFPLSTLSFVLSHAWAEAHYRYLAVKKFEDIISHSAWMDAHLAFSFFYFPLLVLIISINCSCNR